MTLEDAYGLATGRLFLQIDDVDLLRNLAKKLPPDPMVADIGVGAGTTALSVWSARPDAIIVSVDIDASNMNWAAQAIENIGMTSRWAYEIGDSVERASVFKEASFDLIMLDTSHELQPTRDELAAWLPKLKLTGYLWCHDYIGSDVQQAVDEAIIRGELKQVEVRGLGWAGQKV